MKYSNENNIRIEAMIKSSIFDYCNIRNELVFKLPLPILNIDEIIEISNRKKITYFECCLELRNSIDEITTFQYYKNFFKFNFKSEMALDFTKKVLSIIWEGSDGSYYITIENLEELCEKLNRDEGEKVFSLIIKWYNYMYCIKNYDFEDEEMKITIKIVKNAKYVIINGDREEINFIDYPPMPTFIEKKKLEKLIKFEEVKKVYEDNV